MVLNGNKGLQEWERGGRDYQGKGKGKMVEETDSKWMRVVSKESKRSYSRRSNSSGDGEGSRYKDSRREQQRRPHLEERVRDNRDQRESSPHSHRRAGDGEAREEGEILKSDSRATQQENKAENQDLPSRAFQEALLQTQEEPQQVSSKIGSEDIGFSEPKEVLEDTEIFGLEEDRMELDKALGEKENIDDDFQDLTEEDVEEEVGLEENIINTEEGKQEETMGKDRALGDTGKKQGVRRGTFIAGGSTKMRMVQSLITNTKKNATKTGTRRGEGSKQGEDKGALNPKPAPPES